MARKTSSLTAQDDADVDQYNNLRDEAEASSRLLAREQDTPDLTLAVSEGELQFGSLLVSFAGGNSPSFTAPSSNPRIDLLVMDEDGTLERVAGSENVSPVAPDLPANKIAICQVHNRTGQTKILEVDDSTHGYILKDIRPFLRKETSQVIVKLADEDLENSSTLQDDDELVLPMEANKTYQIDLLIITFTDAAPDFQFAFTGPTGCKISIGVIAGDGGTTMTNSYKTGTTTTPAISVIRVSGQGNQIIHIKGSVRVAGSAGDFKLRWAQNTSNAFTTTVVEGSYMKITEQ